MFAYLLIITVAFSAVAVSLIQLVGEYLFTQRIKDDQRIAETLSEQIGQSLVALDIDELMYTVRGAETLAEIAKNFGISESSLLQANPDIKGIYAGLQLVIPSK